MGNGESTGFVATDGRPISLHKLDEITIRNKGNTSARSGTNKSSRRSKERGENSAGANGSGSNCKNGKGNGKHDRFNFDAIDIGTEDLRTRAGSIRQENSIKINLAMADLMAYLQNVASNSVNLPMTRRDDPEIGRTVSTLTAEEYAMRSEAFIPSDFRIIAGSFTRYGNVWDLPTSEEFNPVDGAQEPGVSFGGACVNGILKVLYDTEDSAREVVPLDYDNPNLLFQDDSEEGDDNEVTLQLPPIESKSFASLGTVSTPFDMSWADLLGKVKTEMESAGYAQAPVITSSRKLDLEKPFSFFPADFDGAKNKKRALLIGCKYQDIPGATIKASHDDIRSMQDFIVNIHGFPETEEHMTVLLDDGKHRPPTYTNIVEAFKSLSEASQPGDAVVVNFSGHGCRVMDSPIDDDVNSYDEAIIPSDFAESGIIRDTLIFKTLIAPMRKGVTVTCIIDACDTGMMIDLPYRWTPPVDSENERSVETSNQKMILNDDFSFMRFLKVIKTLYDGSAFTQLGQTVGTALTINSPPKYDDLSVGADDNSDTDVSFDEGSLLTADKVDNKENMSFFTNVLTACHTPHNVVQHNMTDISDLENVSVASQKSARTRLRNLAKRDAGSILHQLLNCTPLLSDDDTASKNTHRDDDTFGDDSDDDSLDDGDTFGSHSISSARLSSAPKKETPKKVALV